MQSVIKLLYNIKLGIKDVDANAISTALLNLSKEITGKASGIIDLNMDKSLKLNGNMKFIIILQLQNDLLCLGYKLI